MKAKKQQKVETLLDVLRESFVRSLRSPEGIADPVALLWTDTEAEWRELIPKLQAALPELYVLGAYSPATRMGPVIWLKCVVDQTIPDVAPPADKIPILYLPGVSRQELRAGADCRPAFQPLIELQYRGRVWHQPNGRDWTAEAFLISDHGLGLDIALDARTREAMRRALPILAETPVDSLQGRRLDADDFDRLSVSDPIRDLLRWMSNPDAFQAALDAARWESFCNVCRSEFNFDPEKDDPRVAATSLATGGGRWDDVWQRFCEAPRLYPGLPDLLREPAVGQGKLALDPSRRPLMNDEAEARLRRELEAVTSLPQSEACEGVLALEGEHASRRDWVWAQLGESPFAQALEPLARLASLARSPIGGSSFESTVAAYVTDGWRCDRAAIQALSSTKGASETVLVARTVRSLYEPWLEASARHLQDLAMCEGGNLQKYARAQTTERETCLLFVDGLRFDLGGLLQEKLEARSFRTHLRHRIAPLPTATPTAKPLVMPVIDDLEGLRDSEDFTPVFARSRQPAVVSRLREQIARSGVEVLDRDELRIPAGGDGGGWAEIGRLDELGHKLGVRLANQIEDELEQIADRVVALLDSGWRRVRVVTDHGWLLLPGGLPKVELPAYLVATKWARCAVVRGGSQPAMPTYHWHWNLEIRIASPPGIASFHGGNEYAHGGVSLQECVVPELTVERAEGSVTASIISVTWRGMRCRVSVNTNDPAVRVDLRLNWKNPTTSIVASIKEVGPAGEASLVVEKDTFEGASATVVALDRMGNVLDRMPTTVGETP